MYTKNQERFIAARRFGVIVTPLSRDLLYNMQIRTSYKIGITYNKRPKQGALSPLHEDILRIVGLLIPNNPSL